MTFNELPPGAKVFLDANTLVYHLAPDPAFGPACTELLLRIQRQDVAGYTSTHMLVAVMRHYGLSNVASADTDLERAGDLARYQPA
jgi:predicted nucleic acid-binding protein